MGKNFVAKVLVELPVVVTMISLGLTLIDILINPWPKSPEQMGENLKIERVLKAFLDRENPTTAQNYAGALDDYRRYARVNSPRAAIERLVECGVVGANRRVERYKISMVGRRDSSGKLVSGRGLSSASVNLRLTVLRSFFKKLRRSGIIDWELDVPNVADERVYDIRGPDMDTLNKMLHSAKVKPGPAGVRDYAILRLACELGLRRREIVGLDRNDVDLEKRELRILGKGRREKEVLSFTPKTSQALSSWMQIRPETQNGDPLFTNLIPGRTGRISGPGVYVIIRELGDQVTAAGKKRRKIGPHKIRHSAITSAVRLAKANGLAREEVQKFSRHRDFRMVARYLDADDRAQAILAKANGDLLE